MITHDITADELAPDMLMHCNGCDRDVEPHVLLTCDGCHQEVCCASVDTLSDGPHVLCRRCDGALYTCDGCGEYALAVTEVTGGDDAVGYRETLALCGVCLGKAA